jgi:hypothetical protein
MTPQKEYWQMNTEKIANEILQSASEARTEEDLKMRVEPILRTYPQITFPPLVRDCVVIGKG